MKKFTLYAVLAISGFVCTQDLLAQGKRKSKLDNRLQEIALPALRTEVAVENLKADFNFLKLGYVAANAFNS